VSIGYVLSRLCAVSEIVSIVVQVAAPLLVAYGFVQNIKGIKSAIEDGDYYLAAIRMHS